MSTNQSQDSKTIRLIYTVCIFVNHFAFGVTSNLLWPALTDLHCIYNVPLETITFISTFGSLGYLIGSASGTLYKWINRQLYLICLCICLGVTMALVPFYTYFQLLFFALTLNGIGGGSWDSSNNVWLVEMWTEKHASIMQASQFMYGLGTIISPLLVSPFVHGDNDTDITPEQRKSSLALPFAMVGSFQTIVPIILLILYFIRPYKPNNQASSDVPNINQSRQEEEESPLEPRQSTRFWKLKVFLVAVMLATYDAAELGYFYYSPTMFLYLEPTKLTSEESAHVSSVLSAAYTVGRLLTAFVSLKLKPDIILSYHFILIIIAQAWLCWGSSSITLIYLKTFLLGYGFSAMWPAILAFTQRHLKLSDRVGSLLFVFAGFVSIFTPFLLGSYLETWPQVLFVFEAGYLSASILLFVIVKLLIIFLR